MFRYEQKYEISPYQYEELKRVIRHLAEPDAHAGADGEYMIRSLYFEDMYRSAYKEKQDGVYQRKKYRIRVYGCSDRVIHLECKHKEGAYIFKEACSLTREEYDKILAGEYEFLLQKESEMAREFYVDVRTKLLRPEVIVDYEREPYVYDAGTVRITFDKHVRACDVRGDLFDAELPSYGVYKENTIILEIKFTGYLPEKIRKIFQVRNFVQTSASKYCMAVDRINHLI